MEKRRCDLILPEMGMASVPITASAWLTRVGHQVHVGERLLEVLAGDVTIDLPAPASGTLVEQCVAEDDGLQVGQVLAVIITAVDDGEEM